MRPVFRAGIVCLLSLASTAAIAGDDAPTARTAEPSPIDFADRIPYGQKPIDYLGPAAGDAVARLNRRLDAGEATLKHAAPNGYLRALLETLDVPIESQLLVFSKTALNPNLVTPQNPRAVYFNEDIYVGWTPGAESIELCAVDPVKGLIFYTLAQDAARPVKLVREDRCLACHAGQTTLQVPGSMVRSFLTDETGKPTAGYSRVTHETSFANRGGGWYITGTHGEQTHLGNLFGRDAVDRQKRDPAAAGNAASLAPWLDATTTARYESSHSDLVAHLVLQHQSHGQNLIIRVGQEARLGRRSDAEDRLLRYLVFADEAPLSAEVRGTTSFRAIFERRGPSDSQKRSLHQLNLKSRLVEHRLSWLIDTAAFEGLPPEVRRRLYERLWGILHGDEPPTVEQPLAERRPWAPYPAAEREAILSIVRATKRDLPDVWREPEK